LSISPESKIQSGRALRTYSSGMVMRLAFSVAIHTDADVILIDEVLAVGMLIPGALSEALYDSGARGSPSYSCPTPGPAGRRCCDAHSGSTTGP